LSAVAGAENTYTITPLKMGETQVPCAEIYWMTKLHGWEQLDFLAFLIEGNGQKILLNTGFARDFTDLHKHWTTWAKAATGEDGHVPVVQENEWVVNALAARGVKPDEITHVLVTPLTAYATGGLDQFPNAQIYVSRRGWIDFHAPDEEVPQLPRHIIFPNHVLQYLVMEAAGRIRLLPDEETDVLPGIKSWFCGGHHRSSMCFMVNTAQGRVALTDAIFKYRNYEESIPLGLSENLEEHFRLFAKLKREADIVLPMYDPEVVQRYVPGKGAK
jgi:glyoxylase-like metal-dependent hydrolase (beta-lactamase superfamily II)